MAIENGVQNAELGYILDPAFQIENINGKPAVGGHIEIFEAGTDNKYISYQNFDGAQNPFKIPLGSDGRAVILGDPSLSYDVYAYDSYNNLMFSRLNVQCNVPGNISIKGADTRINNTDGTLDISLRTLGNNVRQYTINTHNKVLDVQSPLYFVENSETATVIGFSGDDFASKEYVDSAVSSKLDTTAFSNVSGDFLTDKFEYDDDNNITAYNHSAFAGGGGSGPNYEAGDHIAITDNVISVTGLPDSADLENAITSAVTNVENKFEYNENNYITAYNNSAFAGKEYSAGDGISIVNNTISVTSQGGGIEHVSHDDTLSGNGNSIPLGIANIEDFVKQDDLDDYATTADLANKLDTTAFSNVSGTFLTAHQSLDGYATEDWVNSQGYLTAHQSLEGYATTALVSSVSSELYSAFSGISGDYELVAGSGVELVDDPNAKTTTINVTAEGTPTSAIEQMIESATSGLQPSGDYATTAQVAEKLDTTAFSTVSGDFLTAHQDISNLMPKSESANFYPMTGNPSGFLTESATSSYVPVSSLKNIEYRTSTTLPSLGVTAKNDIAYVVNDTVSASGVYDTRWNNISFTGVFSGDENMCKQFVIDVSTPVTGIGVTAADANYSWKNTTGYTASEAKTHWIVEFEEAHLYTDLPFSILQVSTSPWLGATDTISATMYTYNNEVIATRPWVEAQLTGGSVPEVVSAAADYVSATSANINSTIDNVSANSGVWGGSALPISAGPGIDIQLVDDKLVFSAIPNETVLFDVSTGSTAITLSELATNFDSLKITYNSNEATTAVPEIREFPSTATTLNLFQRFVKNSNDFVIDDVQRYNTNDFINYTTTTAAGSHAWYSMPFTYAGASKGSVVSVTKVIGINRIAGGN